MKLLITGANGQLGSEIQRLLVERTCALGTIPDLYEQSHVIAADLPDFDITDPDAVSGLIARSCPDLIINCAALTNVDGCENDRELAMSVNALGPRNLAIYAQEHRTPLVHISTDYVFSGTESSPRVEWDECRPKSIYGYSKLLGERYVSELCSRYFIVRSSWLYGYTGKNFVKTILNLARSRDRVTVVNDQIGSPTSAVDLAFHILRLAVTSEYGIYHCTGNGQCSWYEFACSFIGQAGINCQVVPCTSDQLDRAADRPKYSVLDNMMLRCTVGDEMRNWEDAIQDFMEHYNHESGEFTI